MPIYEYACVACDLRFDRMRPMAQADSPADCPQCGRRLGCCIPGAVARTSVRVQPGGEWVAAICLCDPCAARNASALLREKPSPRGVF